MKGRKKSSRALINDRLLKELKRLKPDRVIFGESHHPRKLPRTVPCPDYLKDYDFGDINPFVQLGYCSQGTCVITLDDHSFLLRQGDLCFIERNLVNYESCVKPGVPYVLDWFLFRRHSVISMHQSVYGQDRSFRVTNHQRVKNSVVMHEKINHLVRLGRERTSGDWAAIKGELCRVFGWLNRQKIIFKTESTNRWHRMILRDVQKYLLDNLYERITLKKVADQFSFNPSYLNTLFKREYSYGINEFVGFMRICRSASLLLRSTLPINEIARKCGYEDPYYFSRIFKKTFGMSPRCYRNDYS